MRQKGGSWCGDGGGWQLANPLVGLRVNNFFAAISVLGLQLKPVDHFRVFFFRFPGPPWCDCSPPPPPLAPGEVKDGQPQFFFLL